MFEPRRQELWTTFCSHHGAAKLIENGVWTDDLRMLKEAQAELEVIQLDGTTRKQIGRIIDLMAEMFSADVPSADALTQWFKLLEPYPEQALKDGAREVLRTHRWRNLPLPADFVTRVESSPVYRAMADESICYRLLRKALEAGITANN